MVSKVFKCLNLNGEEAPLVRTLGSYVSNCVRALKRFLAINLKVTFPSFQKNRLEVLSPIVSQAWDVTFPKKISFVITKRGKLLLFYNHFILLYVIKMHKDVTFYIVFPLYKNRGELMISFKFYLIKINYSLICHLEKIRGFPDAYL